MKLTVYNPQKGRLETIDLVVSETNTTKFDTCDTPGAIEMITDIDDNLVITETGWNYPVIVYGASRESIGYDPNKAKKLRDQSIRC